MLLKRIDSYLHVFMILYTSYDDTPAGARQSAECLGGAKAAEVQGAGGKGKCRRLRSSISSGRRSTGRAARCLSDPAPPRGSSRPTQRCPSPDLAGSI